MMEVIAEGRRQVPSRPYPCGILTVTVRCTECGCTRTLGKSSWTKSRKICPVCARPKPGQTRAGWTLVAAPETGRLYTFRCDRCGRETRKPITRWERPCICQTAGLSDNALERRAATVYARGRALNRNSTSGVRGVCQGKGGWRAYITLDGRQIHLGTFATVEEAAAARRAAETRYFGERQEERGQRDEYAAPAPDGMITAAEWARRNERSKKAALYHVKLGHVRAVEVGGTVYVPEDAPWPGGG